MGITGLIPFLKNASCPINLDQYKGQTLAVDAYCWLHRGIFSCAEKIARGEKCDAYVTYCLKYVNLLISHDIKPILVFDGRYLPAKAATEKKRRQSREQNRAKAAEFLRQGRTAEARRCLRNSVDVGPEMAVAVARACRSVGADCIVAPYEADAQLAYLNRKGIATAVITEDSDLILFGCLRVIFKLDLNGTGLEVVQDRLHQAMDVSPERFSMDHFRQMCILSGCDYLSSLPGIGLAKAKKFVVTTSSPDISRALGKLPSALGMYSLNVSEEYIKEFMMADATFLYQLVYDPIKRCTVPLNDPKEVSLHAELAETIQGERLPSDTEFQLAIGNMDPFHLKVIDDFNPDGPKGQCGGGIGKNGPPKRKWMSIWHKNFIPYGDKNFKSQDYLMKVDRESTFGKEAIMSVGFFQSPSAGDGPVKLCSRKRKLELDPEGDITKETSYTDSELGNMYGSPPKKLKRETTDGVEEEIESLADERMEVNNGKLKRNLFLKPSVLNQGINGVLSCEEKVDINGDDAQDETFCEEEITNSNMEESSPREETRSDLRESGTWLETLEPESCKSPLKNLETNDVKEDVSVSPTVVENSLPTSPILGSRNKSNPFAKLPQSTSVSSKVSGGILSARFSKTAGFNKTPEGKKVICKSRYFANNITSPREKVEETRKAEVEGNHCSIVESTMPCDENVEEKHSENSTETIENIARSYSKVEAKMSNSPVKNCVGKVQSSSRILRNPFPQDQGNSKSSTVLENKSFEDQKNVSVSLRKPLFNWSSLQEKFSCPSSHVREEHDLELNTSLPDNEEVKPKDTGTNFFTSPVQTSTRGRGRGNNCRRPGLVRASTPKTKVLSQGSDVGQCLLSRFGFKKK